MQLVKTKTTSEIKKFIPICCPCNATGNNKTTTEIKHLPE
jgi:hypothetical protein